MNDYTDHIFKLKDGRNLGFAEYGDPNGKPLFAFHGWPSSRLHALRIDKAARKLGVRVISMDRPGYGISDYKDDRTLLEFPDDVIELADHLRVKRFAIMGVSGGGPYAAVCAYKIPERITKAGIVVGLAPTNIKGILDGVSWINKFGWANYHRFPLLADLSAFLGWFEVKVLPINISSFFVSKPDKQMSDSHFRQMSRESRQEAFRQGFKGAALDLKLYSNDWKFDLKKIKVPVYLWYGDKDESVSLNMGKYYAEQIPNSKLAIYPKEGHYCQITHAVEILKVLISS